MASDAKDLFGCPFCGFRVNTTDVSCPRCGNKFVEGTMFECPFCGDMIPQGAPECPSCHVNFSDFKSRSHPLASDDSIDSLLMDIIKLESSQIKSEEKKKVGCPNCSWMLDGTEDRCPKCGTEFSHDSTFQCPICGSFVNSDADKCPECGSPFAGEEGVVREDAAARHEEMTSSLSDLLDSAGHQGPLPEVEKPAPAPEEVETQAPVEAAPVPAKPVYVVVRPQPVKAPPKQQEPVPEPAVPEEPKKAPEEEPPKASPAPSQKKGKQRKLKTKTPGAKSA